MARLKFGALTLLSLTLWGQVYAGEGEPVCVPTQQGCGHLGFEVTLWRPSTAGDAYTIFSPQIVAVGAPPVGELRETDLDYQVGGRVFGSWERCNGWDVAAEYAYFEENHRNQTTAASTEAVWSILVPPVSATFDQLPGGSAFARTGINFQEALIDLGQTICLGSCLSLRLGAGLRYDRFRSRLAVDYVFMGNTVQFAQERNVTWGLGPAFSAEIKYIFCKGLYLLGRLRGALLTGEQTGRLFLLATFPQLEEGNTALKTTTEIFESWDGRLGIGYCRRCGKCLTLSFEVGYETVVLAEALKRWFFYSSQAEGFLQLDTYNVRFNGVYWRASLGF